MYHSYVSPDNIAFSKTWVYVGSTATVPGAKTKCSKVINNNSTFVSAIVTTMEHGEERIKFRKQRGKWYPDNTHKLSLMRWRRNDIHYMAKEESVDYKRLAANDKD